MVIAVPYEDGQVNQHFGRSQAFLIARVESGGVVESGVFPVEGLQHDHSGLSGFLRAKDVEVVVAGNMGPPMKEALKRAGLEVLCGAAGDAYAALTAYVSGDFTGSDTVCEHDHGHHEQGHPKR